MDIHEHDGQRALAAARLTDQFRQIIHQGAEASRGLDRHGTVLIDQPDDGEGGRPEVLRGDLRRILLESLPDGTVQWGRKVADVRPFGDGRHELTFTDGSAVTSSLLVGADGAWSRGSAPCCLPRSPNMPAPRSSRPTFTTLIVGIRRQPRRSGTARCMH